MEELLENFDECLITWGDLPGYVYTEEYKKAFIEFVERKQEAGSELKSNLAIMILHHETGNKHPYFEFDRNIDIESMTLNKKIMKSRLMNIHLSLVKEGKYDVAHCLLRILSQERNDMIEPFKIILERIGFTLY